MAKAITRVEIMQMQCESYVEVRNALRTGDIYFCSGTSLLSRIIEYVTNSAFSHVGIIYRDDVLERILFIESDGKMGVRMGPISKYLSDYNGRGETYPGMMVIAGTQLLSDAQIKAMMGFAMDELTRPYDNWEIMRILLRKLMTGVKRVRDRNYICSEYVYEAFKRAGVEFHYRHRSISPIDIWNDPKVKYKYRIL